MTGLGSLFGFGGQRTARAAPTKTQGVAGFSVYGGYLATLERNPLLVGTRRYETAADILANASIVAAGTRYFLNLLAKANWSVEPAEDQGEGKASDEAKAAAEFLESVLYDMDTSWVRIVRKTGFYCFHGFGIQEWTAKRRDDGQIGFRDVETRPQHTIERWDVDETGAVLGVAQRSPQTAREIYLPRQKLVYLVDDRMTDSPEGMGLLRHLVEPAERLKAYLKLEGIGFERDLRGMPVIRLPITAINNLVKAGELKEEEAQALIQGAKDFVKTEVKKPNTGLVLDSQPYTNTTADGASVSSVMQWSAELLRGESNGIEHLGAAVNRVNREMARIIGCEHLMLGEGSGSRSLSEDKSQNMYLQVDSTLGDIAEGYERDVVGPIWDLNGLDANLKPTLKTEGVRFRDVEQVARVLRDMATAGAVLSPDDPAIDDVRDLAGISRQPELAVDVLQRSRPGETVLPDKADLPEKDQ